MTAQPHDPELERIRAALATVHDPEIPALSVVDLGIVRAITRAGDGTPEVRLTPTYTGCPATAPIEWAVRRALDAAGFPHARIETVLSPPWSTADITEEGRRRLREAGIAPPVEREDEEGFFCEDPAVPCPRCGSQDTEKVSEFGATACKALWRCRSCREPFEYFKCVPRLRLRRGAETPAG